MVKEPLETEYTLPVELQGTEEGPLRTQVGDDLIGVDLMQLLTQPLALVSVTEVL